MALAEETPFVRNAASDGVRLTGRWAFIMDVESPANAGIQSRSWGLGMA